MLPILAGTVAEARKISATWTTRTTKTTGRRSRGGET